MSEDYKTQNYLLAYLDVLGSKKRIDEDQDKSLQKIHNAYDSARKLYVNLYGNTWYDFKIFSDNIIISVPAKNEKNLREKFPKFVVMVSLIQLNFLVYDMLVRGGIVYGSYFTDDLMIWGEALTTAYSLESKIAIYPRIIVDQDLVGLLRVFNGTKNKLKDYGLLLDNDGFCYLDYLLDSLLSQFPSLLNIERDRNEERLLTMKDTKILQKFKWHQNYIQSKFKQD